jgi:ADP-Ribosyltransferase in polyvalent proteins
VIGYHGSPVAVAGLTNAAVGKRGSDFGPGIYFATEQSDAADYGRFVYQANLAVSNPLRVDRELTPEMDRVRKMLRVSDDDLQFSDEGIWHTLMEYTSTLYDIGELTPKRFISGLKRLGYDSIIVPNAVILETKFGRDRNMHGDYIVVFDESQITDWRRINGGRQLTVPQDALDKYEEFHRHAPKRVGEFSPRLEIPSTIHRAGESKWVTYRSDKVDPETLRRPRNPINYIHEHNAGVVTYLPDGAGAITKVPEAFRDIPALVLLGTCLGFAFGDDIEASATAPKPDLYCTPCGKCLIVIQSRESVLAMMWGGALGVFARGIDG